ncbi:MAG TPA: 4Fe-4S dicluster domain-containing protein, partial [Vicinamibacterales bacterium]|nr:4Fe-4S dicluster domain-containing protein [Vicinamibacterales bacterium]
MAITRRGALKAALAGAATAAVAAVKPATLQAKAKLTAPADAVGLLYDTTLCIGCKTCMVACKEANGLEPDTSWSGGLYDAPTDLNETTKNVIKLYDDGNQRSYMKAQCMHCVDPACASACMLGAFKKREFGIVTYDVNLCVG